MNHIRVSNLVTFLFVLSSPTFAVLEIRDGKVHDIDYVINEEVWVDYLAPGKQTTVNLLDGGVINYSGQIDSLEAYEDARINILGGSAGHGRIIAFDRSEVRVTAGYAGVELLARDNSKVKLTGGSVGLRMYVSGNSQIDFLGGQLGQSLFARGHSTIAFGGTIGGSLQLADSSTADVFGGSIDMDLWVGDNAQATLSGGFIGHDIVATGASTITVYGSEFNYSFGQITDSSGRLTGVLTSGESIDNIFYIRDRARIILVPEPAALTLLSLGGLALLRRRRQL